MGGVSGRLRQALFRAWLTERKGKKVLLYRAGLQFESSSREVLRVLGPKIPLLLEKAQPTGSPSRAEGGAGISGDIEMIIEVPGDDLGGPDSQ